MEKKEMFDCLKCSKTFRLKKYLNRHIFRLHSGRKPFKCTECDASLSSKYTLRAHLVIHSGERPFECRLCGKKFRFKNNLIGHSKIHIDIKPIQCPDCPKHFKLADNLKTHQLQVHNTPAKLEQCPLCDKMGTPSFLKIHLRVHTGERPYECDECGETFIEKRRLNYHLFTHREDAPFKCFICNKIFNSSYHLLRHSTAHARGTLYCPTQANGTCGGMTANRIEFVTNVIKNEILP